MENFDIGIIGGGPAGYTAAFSAAKQGKKVVLFEKDFLGGVCLNRGCIPTKTILHSSELYRQSLKSADFGVNIENVSIDYNKVIERKNVVIERLRKGLELAFKNLKIQVVNSEAKILSKNEIEANGEIYNCGQIICAVGSSPRVVKGLEFDHEFLLSSDDVLELKKLPKGILIIGSGAIGIEWARIFNNFGVDTTVVELASNLLPLADIDVSKRVERIFKTEGIKFYTASTVDKIEDKKIFLSNGDVVEPEIVLVAVGRKPNETEKIEGVKYIGDAAGEIQLAHYAIKQAYEEIEKIPFRKDLTPSVVYGSPEIAWVGKREQDLAPEEYKKSSVLVSSLGKAQCDGETEGFIKLLVQKDKIVGAHIVSSEASALLEQILIAMQFGISAESLKEVCFPHPTYSEGIFESLFRMK
ncbi:FAD-dependent oxidoreductase [bacterium]|nr:FAD-dependent oxidoreductase [bacterium]